MKRYGILVGGLFVALASVANAPSSQAGVDISFGVNAPIGDDGNLFFSISSRYFDREPRMVTDWGQRFRNPDDLAVFLHICSQTRVAPEVVYRYRMMGTPWYDVGVRVGIPVDVWYVPVARDPGPPYGKAYGHWKRHQSDPRYRMSLSDRQVRDLVAVRMAHEYYRVSPEVAMNWRRSGDNMRTIMTREYRGRHRDDRPHDDQANRRGNKHGNKGHDDDDGDGHGRRDDHRKH